MEQAEPYVPRVRDDEAAEELPPFMRYATLGNMMKRDRSDSNHCDFFFCLLFGPCSLFVTLNQSGQDTFIALVKSWEGSYSRGHRLCQRRRVETATSERTA